MHYFFVILTSGLLAGIMYAMVAIGFVLIYKASGVFNFAQGSLVLFAALSFVTLTEHGLPFWLAFLVMVFAAVIVERLVLRPLVDRSPLTLFMATLGLSFIIEGLAQLLMGTDVHQLDLRIDDVPTNFLGFELSQFDLFASAVAIVLVAVLSLVFGKTRIGISLRGVADHTLPAQSIGIRLPTIWRVVWSVSGAVSLVAGLLWAARQGVQFSLTAFAYLGTADAHSFDLDKSFEVLFIVLIGGSASLFGNFLGAAFIVLTPIVLTRVVEWFDLATVFDNGVLVNVERMLFGVIIIVLLIREPDGLASLLQRVFARWRAWPLRV